MDKMLCGQLFTAHTCTCIAVLLSVQVTLFSISRPLTIHVYIYTVLCTLSYGPDCSHTMETQEMRVDTPLLCTAIKQ